MKPPSRLDPLNPRHIVAATHAAFGAWCLVRPNLNDFLAGYRPFGPLEPWGVGLLALALVLVFAPRASFLLMLAQLVSAAALFAIALLLSLGVGPLPTGGVIGVLGVVSLLLLVRTFGYWLSTQEWFARQLASPPGWVRRILARREGR